MIKNIIIGIIAVIIGLLSGRAMGDMYYDIIPSDADTKPYFIKWIALQFAATCVYILGVYELLQWVF